MQDSYEFENPSLVCSIFLMVVILVSCGVIVLIKGTDPMRKRRHYPALMMLAASILILLAKWSTHIAYLAVPCVCLGIGYGMFLSSTKQYANCSEDSGQMISLYNISQTIACLCAYAVSYVISRLSVALSADTNTVNLLVILFSIALAAVLFWRLDPGGKGKGSTDAAQSCQSLS
jgi:ATP/ADP translocase